MIFSPRQFGRRGRSRPIGARVIGARPDYAATPAPPAETPAPSQESGQAAAPPEPRTCSTMLPHGRGYGPAVVQRHVEQCPACSGLCTEEDLRIERTGQESGRAWISITLICPHCGNRQTKRFWRSVKQQPSAQ